MRAQYSGVAAERQTLKLLKLLGVKPLFKDNLIS